MREIHDNERIVVKATILDYMLLTLYIAASRPERL
jgi:hypothetical protein